MCGSGGSDGDEDETEEKYRDRRLTAEERHGGDKFRARFVDERRMRRRRVADIVLPAAEREVDVLASPVWPFLLQITNWITTKDGFNCRVYRILKGEKLRKKFEN